MTSLPPRLSSADIASLLDRVDAETTSAQDELDDAQSIAQAAGLTVYSSVLDPTYPRGGAAFASTTTVAAASSASSAVTSGDCGESVAPIMDLQREAALAVQARQNFNPLRGTLSAFPLVLSTSAGHSNTDHIIHQNPDGTIDKFQEYKRRLKRRARQSQLEERGTDRWDLPRIPGGRRRRIKRDADAPSAPPEPPTTGYVIYVSQMTTKLRHDNPERHHNQISAVKRISAMWNNMPEKEREHYVKLAKDGQNVSIKMLLLHHRLLLHRLLLQIIIRSEIFVADLRRTVMLCCYCCTNSERRRIFPAETSELLLYNEETPCQFSWRFRG